MFRLQYAATMLASGKYSVADVAYQVGYSDPKYFSSCFAEKYGMSPSQYAKSKRQE
jgi:AraC-like DNA-binding protein